MDYVERTQKLSLNDTGQDDQSSLEDTLKVFGDICKKIEEGAEIKLEHPSSFYYDAAQEVEDLRKQINELNILLEGAKRGIERYIYGPIEIVDESGNVITEIDEWVSKELINGAISTYILKGIVRGTQLNANND